MIDVKRYDMELERVPYTDDERITANECADGEWVRWSDCGNLQKELDALRKQSSSQEQE